MRKAISAAFAGLLVCATLVTPALAHGHGHGSHHQSSQTAKTTYAQCEVEGCTQAGRHLHNGVYYCGTGHQQLCEVEGCTVTGLHLHDGTYYCGTDHQQGYCDGECPVAAAQVPSRYYAHHSSRYCR